MLRRLPLSRWLQTRSDKEKDAVIPATPPLAPEERKAALLAAREVIAVLGDRLPPEVEGWLSERAQPATVNVLCSNDFPDAMYLLALKERGYQLFDAFVPQETLLFFDRERCYRLPDWNGLAGAFSLACSLMMSKRVGCYCLLEGTVAELPLGNRLFKLTVSEHFWVWVTRPRNGDRPPLGARVKVLGINSWIGGATTHLLHGVLVVDLAAAGSPAAGR